MKFAKKFSSIIFLVLFIVSAVFTLYFIVDVGGYGKVLNLVKAECKKAEIEPSLALAIIKTESNFNKNAVSKKGAVGLMQLTNSTAKYVATLTNFKQNYDLFSEVDNVYLGVQYLKYLSKKFSSKNAVICAYNAGETKVKDWLDNAGEIAEQKIDYKETKNYLKKVKRRQNVYKILIN